MAPDWLRRFTHSLIWLLPISLIVILPMAAKLTTEREQLDEYLRLWGRQVGEIRQVSLRGFGGMPLLSDALLPSPRHSHDFEKRLTVLPSGLEIAFAHFGDGPVAGTGQSFRSTIFLTNMSPYTNRGSISFYDDGGNPLSLTLNGQNGTSFPFELARTATHRFETSGGGTLKSGWVRVVAEQPVGGQVVFGIRDSRGGVVTDVGVSESQLGQRFTIFADSLGTSRTGVALCNPNGGIPVTLNFALLNSGGQQVALQQRTLQPFGHLGIFLNELFSKIPGIDEFQGSVVITSEALGAESAGSGGPAFAGVTLRSTGSLLTSLPMVETKPLDSPVKRMAFPHIGDGDFGTLAMATSVILINTTSGPAAGTVNYLNSDGTPMEVTIGSESASSFLFQLEPLGVTRLTTSGDGNPKVGWVEVIMDQELSGSAIFQLVETAQQSAASVRAAAALVAEVGVAPTPIYKRSRILIDTSGVFNTGLALVNPADPVEDNPNPITVNLSLYDSTGGYVGATSLELQPRSHESKFITQLFTDLEDDFQGSLLVTSGNYFAPIALRSAAVKLTSTPTILGEIKGFAPTSTLVPAQNMAGTSPALRWTLHQNDGDFSLERVRIQVPEMGLAPSAVKVGDELASGYFPRGSNSRVFRFFVTDTGSIDFDAFTDTGDGLQRQGSGTISGSASGGLTLEMQLAGKKGFTEVADTADQYFDFPPGIFRLPEGDSQIEVSAEFTSVSTRPDRELRVTRKTIETLDLATADPTKANLVSVSPTYLEPGEVAIFTGSNFGDDPVILFPVGEGEPLEVATYVRDDGATAAFVPQGIRDGTISIDNGSGAGNPYNIDVLFAPTFSAGVLAPLEPAGGPVPRNTAPTYGFEITQDVNQLAATDFVVEVGGLSPAPGTLQLDALVGSGSIYGTAFALKVTEIEEGNQAFALALVSPTDPSQLLGGILRLEFLDPTSASGLRFTYWPEDQEDEPFFVDRYGGLKYEFRFDGLSLNLPTTGDYLLSAANVYSAPMGGGGLEASRSVQLFSIEIME